jgi:hypothetical protein
MKRRMKMQKVEVKEVVNYKGHSVRANGSVDLSFSAMYDEITKTIECLQMLNNDVVIIAKLPNEKPIRLGMYRIKNVSFDDDGESVIKFNSIDLNVELDNLSRIVTNEKFQIKMEAEVEDDEDIQQLFPG